MLFLISASRRWNSILWLCLFLSLGGSGWAEPWWSVQRVEDDRAAAENVQYRRLYFETVLNEPVRAHLLQLTDISDQYIMGVLGSYGALFTPGQFAKSSHAVAVVNGGFFSAQPTRALGMVTAHHRVLYPPPANSSYHSSVGFLSNGILFGWVKPEDIKEDRISPTLDGWKDCHAALGAGPMLLSASASVVASASDTIFNLSQRAPRTAIGKRADGAVLLLVVDGRQPSWSAGVTLGELTEMMAFLQATDALNLDGGGSSTMVLNGELMNRPSDGAVNGNPGQERPVANVVALFRRK